MKELDQGLADTLMNKALKLDVNAEIEKQFELVKAKIADSQNLDELSESVSVSRSGNMPRIGGQTVNKNPAVKHNSFKLQKF